MNIIQKPSPNFVAGRGGYKPELICIHIMAGSLTGTDDWFMSGSQKNGTPVSSHYGTGLKGEVHQYVDEANVAWTQGIVNSPSFKLYKPGVNPNKYMISIENEGNDLSVAPQAQIDAIVALIKDISARWGIPIDRDHIIGHYQVDSLRKPNCPSPDKSILDKIVALAQSQPVAVDKKAIVLSKLDELRKMIVEML